MQDSVGSVPKFSTDDYKFVEPHAALTSLQGYRFWNIHLQLSAANKTRYHLQLFESCSFHAPFYCNDSNVKPSLWHSQFILLQYMTVGHTILKSIYHHFLEI